MKKQNDHPVDVTATAIKKVLEAHALTGEQAANFMYLSDSRAVRRYTNGERSVDIARWFVLHAKLVLDAATIKRIEQAMDKAANEK